MTAALVFARLALSAVFAFAALGKLFDLNGSQRAVERFGVSGRISRPVGLLLPVVELVLALALVPAQTARAAAVTSCGLLLVFCAAIARSVVHRESHDCHCFGRLRSAPVGVTTLVRTGTLTALAVVIAWRPISQPGMTELTAVAAALVAAQAWLWLELLRRYGRALRRIDELETAQERETPTLGSHAPPFVLPDLDGRLVSLESLIEASGETILLFTSSGCPACELALEAAGHSDAAVVAISPRGITTPIEAETVALDRHGKVAHLYGVSAVPTAFLVDSQGLIKQGPAVGSDHVVELIHAAAALREAA